MTTKVQKWGNSLGIRLPKAISDSFKIGVGSELVIIAEADSLILKPVKQKNLVLKDLLIKINPNNLHTEIGWGKSVGKEIW